MSFEFDWEFYLQYNTDVCETFGYSENGAKLHYLEHGILEDRIYSEAMLFKRYPFMQTFDWSYYKDNNSDLVNLSKFLLIKHYIHQGYREQRQILFFTPIFNYLPDFTNTHNNINKSPKISIIIPIYNRPEYLVDCINSIINQTYMNWELLLVDDGSNAETKEILEQFNNNPKITILTNEMNYGCYVSINMALGLCNGEYITIHGSDDISFPNRLMKMVNLAVTNNLLMVGTYILRTHFETFTNVDVLNNLFGTIVTQQLDNAQHNGECCKPIVSLGTLMYHKTVFQNIGCYENIRKGGDMVFFEKYLQYYENIEFTKYDCSHRYLTKVIKGKTFEIISEILYLSPNMTQSNITSQNIKFDITEYRK